MNRLSDEQLDRMDRFFRARSGTHSIYRDAEQLIAEVRAGRLAMALLRYEGMHEPDCDAMDPIDPSEYSPKPCSCGYEEALERYRNASNGGV